jgi:hypothetical protein
VLSLPGEKAFQLLCHNRQALFGITRIEQLDAKPFFVTCVNILSGPNSEADVLWLE